LIAASKPVYKLALTTCRRSPIIVSAAADDEGKEARSMHVRMVWPVRVVVLALGVFAVFSLTHGQEQQSAPSLDAPRAKTAPANPKSEIRNPKSQTGTIRSSSDSGSRISDFSKLSPLHKQIWLSAQRGAEWLYRANVPDGRFTNGVAPALGTTLEGDHYLRQAGAAAALARAARFFGDQRYAARATQSVVTLLADTAQDPRDPRMRSTVFPPASVNRLAAAGLLVLAIHELPDPDKDLLAKAEQLCNFIHGQQQADGSLSLGNGPQTDGPDAEAVNYYPGEALYGLIRSQQRQPAAWKIDVVRNALAYYKAWWRKHPDMAFVPWQTAAYAEAFLSTKEHAFADFVFEMNDWIVRLQYQGFDDPKQVVWSGGFKGWTCGKSVETMPMVSSASYAEGLAEACRVARTLGDLPRHQSYTGALERCLAFLTTLQYTEANTQHFAEWYRPTLLGGFHASHQDGNLRIDYTQHAGSAMVQYLTHVARLP
jgi:hypothetical protein